jgi:hypothetical protein
LIQQQQQQPHTGSSNLVIFLSIGKLRQEAWAALVGLSNNDSNNTLGDEEQAYQRKSSSRPTRTNNTSTHTASGEKTVDIVLEVDLIGKDVGRSVLFRFRNNERDDWSVATPSGQKSSEEDVADKFDSVCSERLAQVLERTISEPMAGNWHYYQGLHDIAGVYVSFDWIIGCCSLLIVMIESPA